MKAPCVYCKDPVDIDERGVYRKVNCWAQNDARGKPTKIADAVELRQYAHKYCFETKGWHADPLF